MARKRGDKISGPDIAFAERFIKLQGEITNKTLSGKTGISGQAIGRYRKGESSPLTIDIEQLQRLCDAFNVTADYLLFGKEPEGKQKFLKISYQIIKTNGVRQIIFTASPTTEIPFPGFTERRTKSDIYIDLP
jgi:transcriptional regulator with XRE-family HTH domain